MSETHDPHEQTPAIKDHPLYQLLRDGKVAEFNARRQAGETCDLTGTDFRGLDLRGLDAAGLDLSNSYFRQADLRGVDLSTANLAGASIHGTKISGVHFPPDLPAEEIVLSLEHGTRLRYGVPVRASKS
ncbi:MAG: pentapeptide repeat-containing protein [Gammaproteobacteria bacterium]